MRNKIYNDTTETIGNTPLVRLNRLCPNLSTKVLAKLEFFNPAGSVKDRIAKAIIDAAESSGALKPGGTIIEGTSGNTGIALAMIGAARGYNVILTMPETMSLERRVLLKAFGAEIVLTPGSGGMRVATETAEQIASQHENAIWAKQFENLVNPEIHRRTTAQEIWDDTNGKIDIFVSGIGTGGTITGVGQVLKEKNPNVHIVAVEPADSPLLTGGTAGPHGIQGIGANFIPKILDTTIYDQVFDVQLDDALQTAKDLARCEGILAGISSGAIIWSALELAKQPQHQGKTIVAMVCDTGERYISTPLWSDLNVS